MFSEELQKEQPFTTKLFAAAIKSNRLVQAYLFTQSQAIVQYHFAMELAKILNCSNIIDDTPCNNCTDCKWINTNTHPAVITVSPVDFLPQDEKGKTKNIVKVSQARLLQKTLMTSSKYHRVVIFTGARDEKLPAEEMDKLWLNYKDKVKPPESIHGRELWVADHLNKVSFPSEPANLLLKTIEEPQGKILLIFITKDADDMISTIVSRCQIVPLLRQKDLEIEPIEYIQEIATLLPPQNELDCITIAKKLIEFSKKEQIKVEKILEYIEMLYHKQLLDNVSENAFAKRLIKQIQKIEETKNMIHSYVNPQAALISMLNALI